MKRFVLTICAAVGSFLFQVVGEPVSQQQSSRAIQGWLQLDSTPLEASLGRAICSVDVYSDTNGIALFYVHALEEGGFAITSADDLIEPVIAFSAFGMFEASPDNPLWDLLCRDMRGRQKIVRERDTDPAGVLTMNAADDGNEEKLQDAQSTWSRLIALADADLVEADSRSYISDVRVSPLVQSTWSQTTASGLTCYNYYTQDNNPCGCVATAMAQVMRYHEYPTSRIGVHSEWIWVDDQIQRASTRGGDGSGGAYSWNDMPLEPNSGITLTQRKAIGALCYDAGVACSMSYSSSGSGSTEDEAAAGLMDIFDYDNAVYYMNYNYNMTTDFRNRVINCNLDAGCPVMVGITETATGGGHEIVCDGYGYHYSTLYHHMNLGWSGSADAWYALPDIAAGGAAYDIVDGFVYNIFPSGSGEIISGRIVDEDGDPLEGVSVSSGSCSDTTDRNGIYALRAVSAGTHVITASKDGCQDGTLTKTVSASYDYQSWSGTADFNACGNVWGANLVLNAAVGDYNSWLSDGAVPAGQQGLGDDPAGDGIANVWKYAAGIPAMTACSWQDIYSWTNRLESSQFSLIYRQSIAAAACTMIPEWAADAGGSWQTTGMVHELIDSNPTQEIWRVSIPAAAGSGFFRLTVEATP